MLQLRMLAVGILFFVFPAYAQHAKPVQVDICIYGATSAGVIAAYTAKMQHHSVLLIDPGKHIGGLTSGGLGFTDIGNKYAVSGLGLDFYRRVGKQYGQFESWIFEPHVATAVFSQYLKLAKVEVALEHTLQHVSNEFGYIKEIELNYRNAAGQVLTKRVAAKMFIDCSYEGDLMAKAGVSFTVGRESGSLYNESFNGVQLRDKHQFPDGVDPYKIPGRRESGLLWGISDAMLLANGSADTKVQAYNFRICLTDDAANRIAITRPSAYDSTRYELLLRLLQKKPAASLGAILKIDRMPNHKTDINNNGPFSTDMIGMNYGYPEGDQEIRNTIRHQHEVYIKGLLYFIGHDQRMPENLRKEMLNWGYPKDEFTNNNNFTPQLYVREARRMIGDYVMTQANCQGKEVVTDGIGLAAYTMDSHNCERIVVNDMVKNEGDVQVGGFGPYPISYRSIIPGAKECKNLLVPVCLSASHIAYGSIRMEPVFMVLGQVAATAASMAIKAKAGVQEINVPELQQALKTNPLADGSLPEIVIDNDNTAQVQIKGSWTTKEHLGYGPSVLTADEPSAEERSVQYQPVIEKEGYYHIYVYMLPAYNKLASQTMVAVYDGNRETRITLKKRDMQVQGQTSGEWIAVGKYKLPAGSKAHVTIQAANADGAVVADAVLLIPERK
ncbi:xanthan lyase [Niastella vici]|uniref:Xanthan lyase n=1 Tax=Niastella vici TaxID=1703345 RepID=A0A1V9FTQ4_9BACT|nr:FAD-dependent oxidoreductase [Niastella vici]OQP61759.1 xanthan lyase [Niastella vici]